MPFDGLLDLCCVLLGIGLLATLVCFVDFCFAAWVLVLFVWFGLCVCSVILVWVTGLMVGAVVCLLVAWCV